MTDFDYDVLLFYINFMWLGRRLYTGRVPKIHRYLVLLSVTVSLELLKSRQMCIHLECALDTLTNTHMQTSVFTVLLFQKGMSTIVKGLRILYRI